MRTFLKSHPMRLVAAAAFGWFAAGTACGAELSTVGGRVAYTASEPDEVAVRVRMLPATFRDAEFESRLIASVDASAFASHRSMIAIQASNFDPRHIEETAASMVARAIDVQESATSRVPQPGFWSAALATLALSLFVFVRRVV